MALCAAGSVDLYSIENQRWDRLFEHKTARDDSYLAEWKDFIACIDTEHEPGVSGEDGLKVLKLIDAIRRSEELGARVSMGL